MGAFYGGIAHVPLASLVLVCELAGNYDLLVPLMLALAISFVLLRRRSLYDAQPPTLRDSPVHRDAFLLEVLRGTTARDVMITDRPFVTFSPSASAKEIVERVGESTWQEVFPVIDESGGLVGLVSAEAAHVLGAQPGIVRWTIVADVMLSPTSVIPDDDLRLVTERLVASGLRELPVVDATGRVIGFIDEAEIVKLYLGSAQRVERKKA
jgi:CIC family chloride channel protein